MRIRALVFSLFTFVLAASALAEFPTPNDLKQLEAKRAASRQGPRISVVDDAGALNDLLGVPVQRAELESTLAMRARQMECELYVHIIPAVPAGTYLAEAARQDFIRHFKDHPTGRYLLVLVDAKDLELIVVSKYGNGELWWTRGEKVADLAAATTQLSAHPSNGELIRAAVERELWNIQKPPLIDGHTGYLVAFIAVMLAVAFAMRRHAFGTVRVEGGAK
jgi:hypothetical protein